MTVSTKKYVMALASTAVLALGLYGCGGGGGDGPMTGGDTMMPDDGDTMMPDDGDTMMPDDGMATEFGDDRLTASPLASPEAETSADTLASLVDTDIALAPVSSPIGMEYDAQNNVRITSLKGNKTAYIESATVLDSQGNITIVYVVGDRRTEVHFQARDWTGFDYEKTVGGTTYFAWWAPTFTGVPRQNIVARYMGLFGWQAGQDARGYAVDGLLTPPDRLTSLGGAIYEGQMVADYWRTNDPTPGFFDNLGTVWGEIMLEADFSGGSIEGAVDNIWIEEHGNAYSDTWVQLAATNSIQISDGTIDGNSFHAEWEGQDTDTSSALAYSMRDFDGSLLGEFYGPNGEEAGGVLTGQRESTNQLINGRFGAERQ